jgi:insertion element IS1 protein InsB
VCPRSKSPKEKKPGHLHNGTPHQPCHACGRQCVQGGEPYRIAEDQRRLSARLLVERMALRGSRRAVGVTRQGLWGFLVQCFAALPAHRPVPPVSAQHAVLSQRRAGAAEALARLGQKPVAKQWGGSAMDATPRQSMAWHGGARRPTRAAPLWAKMPPADRQHATCYTDQEVVSEQVMPAAPHQALSKGAQQTHHLARCHNPLRQRVSRLGRGALSFSKKLANHIGAIQLFICHYNLTRAAA